MQKIISKEIKEHQKIIEIILNNMQNDIEKASHEVISTLKNGNKILLFGNGGSAADAQHIAAELSGRYKRTRIALPAIALTTDTSALTAISNDYGFEMVFSRQVEALANKNDLLIAISTSGTSRNIINAINIGQKKGCSIIGLCGNNGGEMKNLCDINLIVPSSDTARIQESHILIAHIICQIVDNNFS